MEDMPPPREDLNASGYDSSSSYSSDEFALAGEASAVTLKSRANPRKNKIHPKVISTLIKSRQTPKLRMRAVRRVIKGRSEPTIEIIME